MKKRFTSVVLLLIMLAGCAPPPEAMPEPLAISGFIGKLKEEGVDGSLALRAPMNDDMEYIAEYVIARYTSTRVISIFKCKDEAAAKTNLQLAMENTKLSGQARNGAYIMAATFYPEDNEAVEKIKTLFLAHPFE